MQRIICTLSGGKSSAFATQLAIREYGAVNCILYFNDTGWEHPDLYRFLDDLSAYFGIPITNDSDGRNPETLFFDQGMLANSRVPFCSSVLKAQRLQRFVQDGDTLIFGISHSEAHRAVRIARVYDELAMRKRIKLNVHFPLMTHNITGDEIDNWFSEIGIELPALYRMGFKHNNCGGGCVRSGKAQWLHLLRVDPATYHAREQTEEAFRELTGKDVHFIADTTLKALRERAELQPDLFVEEADETVTECVGICLTEN